MCSDLIGLQGLLLDQAQTGKGVPKSKSPSIPESPGYWEHKMRLGTLVLSWCPGTLTKTWQFFPPLLPHARGCPENPHTRQTQCLATTTYSPERPRNSPAVNQRTQWLSGDSPSHCLNQPLNTNQARPCVPARTGSTSRCVFPNPVYKSTLKN